MVPDDDDIGSAPTSVGTPTPPPTHPTQASVAAGTGPNAPPAMLAGRYEILGLLGMGGMGRVYRAHDRSLDEIVALKMLRRELVDQPGILERFRQEVKLARRVTHANVVRTFDLGEHATENGPEHFLTMEFIDGRSLAQRLDDGPLAIDDLARIARAMSEGLAAAHAAGVLHRDLKPDNVLVATSGRVALSDFGIARVARAAGPSATATSDGFIGTPAYMAPEQVEGRADLGPTVDIYAFGAILFEMITGRRPFAGSDPFAVAFARLQQPPPDPRSIRPVSDALATLVLRCLARDPAARFPDAAALGGALASLHTMPAVAAPMVPFVPGKTSRAIAVLPLRATDDLADIAEGLTEEIVDALSVTRALRVRPLASVRRIANADVDARELGKTLGVDVIVDGSIRRRGPALRVTARAIGVEDGFQLWASHVDTAPDGLLAAGDEVARAVARALTVELDMPERAARNARATELYLEAKARVRASWMSGETDGAIALLDEALALVPDDAPSIATLAMAHARKAFFGHGSLTRPRELAERAVALDPKSGEAWLALALAHLYAASIPDAARALVRAVIHAPGFAMAQWLAGAVLLEAGAFDDALAHLEAAHALDPGSATTDLARAYMYAGRDAEARRLLEKNSDTSSRLLAEQLIARFEMWRGRTYAIPDAAMMSPDKQPFAEAIARFHRTGKVDEEERRMLAAAMGTISPRLLAGRSQFLAEFMMFAGEHDEAMRLVGQSVTAGLQDLMWLEHCPLLEPIRARPEFAAHVATVAARARAVIAAVHAEAAATGLSH